MKILKILKCTEIGGTTCNFIAEGIDNDMIKNKMVNHVKTMHKTMSSTMTKNEMYKMDMIMDKLIRIDKWKEFKTAEVV